MTPDAHIDDGLLDVCMVDMLGVVKVAQYIPLIEKGCMASYPKCGSNA
jgi:diacylglycerol kinase family enzyme